MFVSSKHALGAEGVNGADEVQDALAQQVDDDAMEGVGRGRVFALETGQLGLGCLLYTSRCV